MLGTSFLEYVTPGATFGDLKEAYKWARQNGLGQEFADYYRLGRARGLSPIGALYYALMEWDL